MTRLDERDVWQLLEKGSVGTTEAVPRDGASRLRKYDGLADPEGTERLGSLLAESARDLHANVVVVWEEVPDLVLGYVVGLRLGVPAVRAYDAEGLVDHTGLLPEEPVGVLVTDVIRDERPVRAVRALLQEHGGRLAAVLVLVGDALTAADVLVRSLVQLPSSEEPKA